MSVAPDELISAVWTQWQGHVINDTYRLGRYLGCSDHSGVFLTNSAALGASDVAIKLIPVDRLLVEPQLLRWSKTAELNHPHLLKLLQWGECQLEGLLHLYVVMEYADQTLAQLLQRRALSDDEAREMLPPILDALSYLNAEGLVQGQLRPENVLVVGDQLKLASDRIRKVGESPMSGALTAFDPPEARSADLTTAWDIWALGVCLLEALSRRAPDVWNKGETIALPADFSPACRAIVERCLKPTAQSRPKIAELVAWARGQDVSPAPETAVPLPTVAVLKPAAAELAPPIARPPRAPEASPPSRGLSPRILVVASIAVTVIVALGWAGVSKFGSDRTAADSTLQGSTSQPSAAGAPETTDAAQAAANKTPQVLDPSDPAATTALHEVIPEVPHSAQRKIKGHIEVPVRITIDPSGSVIAVAADRTGRSKYFPRIASEAARKWTFPPVAAQARRMVQIHFDFSRDQTTARVVP